MTQRRTLLLAVDGGQTHSLAILALDNGRVIGAGAGGLANHFLEPGGPERFNTSMHDCVGAAFLSAGLPLQQVRASHYALTGVHEQMAGILQRIAPSDWQVIAPDRVASLWGATLRRPAVLVLAGTGAIACCYEATRGMIDTTQVTDDWGSQHGLLASQQVFNRFYRGATQRAIDLARSYGIHVFHHDDGDMRALLPTLAGMGIDILNPIQWRCGQWDLHALKAEYGQRLCFHSAVDNQETLPFGTPADVRREVRSLIAALASDHTGFIIGPCHNLQPITPLDNILALYDAAREYGQFV